MITALMFNLIGLLILITALLVASIYQTYRLKKAKKRLLYIIECLERYP